MFNCKECLSNGGLSDSEAFGQSPSGEPRGDSSLSRFLLQECPNFSELGNDLECSRKTTDSWTLEI